jgi:undecaprenyl pyrophosphate synthase
MSRNTGSRLETLLLILNESDLLESDDLDLLFSRFFAIQKFGVLKLIVYADVLSILDADKKEALCRLLKQNVLKKYEALPSKNFDCFVLTNYESSAPIFSSSSSSSSSSPSSSSSSSSSDFSVYFVLGLGGRKELHMFLTEFVENCQKGMVCPDELTHEMISSHLKLPFEPDFILLEKSTLTDFMIWQTTYSEYGFFEKKFQKISDSELIRLLESFNKRERRFGV